MHKVEMMTQSPVACLTCGRGNTADDPHSMDEFFAIDLERDVNWGDSTYICRYCCDELAAIAGFVTEEQLAEMTEEAAKTKKEMHELQAEFDAYRRRARTILAGKKQEKMLKADAVRAEKAEAKAAAKKAAKTPKAKKAA